MSIALMKRLLNINKRINIIPVFSLVILLVFYSSCKTESTNNSPVNSDSLNKANIVADSIEDMKQNAVFAAMKNIKSKNTVSVYDKTVTVIKNATIDKDLKFEYVFDEYYPHHKERIAERDETFLNIRIRLSSKSKWNNGDGNFLPNLNVFWLDKTNTPNYVGTMAYQLYKEDDLNTAVLEQIFDYKESEIFVCWLSINTPKSGKYVISVNSGDRKNLDINTVIGIIIK